MPATTDLDDLGLTEGGHVLLQRALAPLEPGDRLQVRGRHPALALHLAAWCRQQGHLFEEDAGCVIRKGTAERDRLQGAIRAGQAGVPQQRADPRWGLAARGALIEQGGPPIASDLLDRDLVWADSAPRLYAAACAAQWDPQTAIDWSAPCSLPGDVEAAVVQVMTYLVESEQAALLIPARMLGRIHPHFREVLQLLAIQAADEARHIEVFTRRAALNGMEMGVSGAGGRASLDTLLHERDFTLAGFLLSVLGEGSFLDLLRFLHQHAPDPVTSAVCRLALQDESRHVAFGVSHTAHAVTTDAHLLGQLRSAVERRHSALLDTAGLNQQVFDALVILAAGSWEPSAIRHGWLAVQQLQRDMDDGRRRRLARIGFPADEAEAISALHSRNFM